MKTLSLIRAIVFAVTGLLILHGSGDARFAVVQQGTPLFSAAGNLRLGTERELASKIDLSNGLVAYYSFDDGTAIDNSGNGNNGVLFGGVSSVMGVRGNALDFNGTNGFVQVSNSSSLNLSTEFTIIGTVFPRSFYTTLGEEWIVILTKGNTSSMDSPYAIIYQNIDNTIKPHVRMTSGGSALWGTLPIANSLFLNRWNTFAWRYSNGTDYA